MKTTLELPDELLRQIKVRAAKEDRKLKDLVADLLRQGLVASEKPLRRVHFPLIHSSHPADPDKVLTPEQLDEVLLEEEVRWALGK